MKKLTDILTESSVTPLVNSDAELENLAEESYKNESKSGNPILTMSNLNNVLEMVDNLYNTIAELETIDEETQSSVRSLTKTVKGLYENFSDQYMITEVNLNTNEGTALKEILNQ